MRPYRRNLGGSSTPSSTKVAWKAASKLPEGSLLRDLVLAPCAFQLRRQAPDLGEGPEGEAVDRAGVGPGTYQLVPHALAEGSVEAEVEVGRPVLPVRADGLEDLAGLPGAA